jgi:hypothetical protein
VSKPDYPPVLVVDIETTSAHRYNAGIVEIGALWLEPVNSALESLSFETKLRPHLGCEPHQARALEINGCDWINDPTVAPEAEAIEAFAEWIKHTTPVSQWPEQKHGGWIVMAGMNVGQFDFTNLESAFHRAGLVFPFAHRVVDVQTLAFANAAIHGQSLLKAGGMTSSDVQTMLGLPIEPEPHRALCGALLEGHALYELLYMTGKAPVEWGMLERRFFPELGNAPLLQPRCD